MNDEPTLKSENNNLTTNDHNGPPLDGETELSFESRKPFYMNKYHWHQQIEVNVIYKGTVEYIFNNGNIQIKAGEMVLFWAVAPHRVNKVSEDALMEIINIPLNMFLSRVLPERFVQQVMHGGVIQSGTEGIVSIDESNRWLKCYQENDETRIGIVQDEIFLMLRRLCFYDYQVEMFSFLRDVTLHKANYTGYKNVQLMLDYIANNHNTDIKVDDIAAYVKLHPKYAMSLFKNMLSVSIKQYLIIMRINHAKVLLGNTRNPIKNIATNSGFKHPSSFFAAFKKHTDITPQEFREQSQNNHI
ncbi:helix-turn-helix domain-containing protein [Vibrio sp. 2-Bac 85]